MENVKKSYNQSGLLNLLDRLFKKSEKTADTKRKTTPENKTIEVEQPRFSESKETPVKLTEVIHPDGRLSQYPPSDKWENWTEWDAKAWPRKVARNYHLVPTVCFNCESGCGLLAYVDKKTFDIKKFEGNPVHPGSRGRNCAKGPATLNQVYDPERIMYPMKRTGRRGEGKWQRVSWEQALEEIGAKMRQSRKKSKTGIMYHVGRPASILRNTLARYFH